MAPFFTSAEAGDLAPPAAAIGPATLTTKRWRIFFRGFRIFYNLVIFFVFFLLSLQLCAITLVASGNNGDPPRFFFSTAQRLRPSGSALEWWLAGFTLFDTPT